LCDVLIRSRRTVIASEKCTVADWYSARRFLLRDRDRIFSHDFVKQVKAIGIKQVLSAPRPAV
jgi:hypothetical protein